jgi:hypothetical protein
MNKITCFLLVFLGTFTALSAQNQELISIIGVGDMMLGSNYPDKTGLPPDEGKQLLMPVNEILKNADITFGNLEGVVLNSGGKVKKCSNPKICYAFRMPEFLIDNLLTAGFDAVSIANNHVGDFGQEGRDNTLKILDDKKIAAAGLLSRPVCTFEKNGVKYGLAAFAPNSGTVNIRDIEAAKKIVSELAEKTDIVIVSFHGGAEGRNHQHVSKKTEMFYGEDRGNVYAFAHAVVDAGADVVFGHGPHVTRAVELYKNRLIAYSLGNFCTYGGFNLKNENGLAPILKVIMNKSGEFVKAEITPIKQPGRGGVVIDEEKKIIKIIKALTEKDFPETPLHISDEGVMTKK